MRQFYNLINDRAVKYIPEDQLFNEVFPDYTDWCVIWYREAWKLCSEFKQEGLVETAQSLAVLIQDNLSSKWHDHDRHIILNKLKHDYNIVVDTL